MLERWVHIMLVSFCICMAGEKTCRKRLRLDADRHVIINKIRVICYALGQPLVPLTSFVFCVLSITLQIFWCCCVAYLGEMYVT